MFNFRTFFENNMFDEISDDTIEPLTNICVIVYCNNYIDGVAVKPDYKSTCLLDAVKSNVYYEKSNKLFYNKELKCYINYKNIKNFKIFATVDTPHVLEILTHFDNLGKVIKLPISNGLISKYNNLLDEAAYKLCEIVIPLLVANNKQFIDVEHNNAI